MTNGNSLRRMGQKETAEGWYGSKCPEANNVVQEERGERGKMLITTRRVGGVCLRSLGSYEMGCNGNGLEC